MTLIRIEAPAAEPVELDDLKVHLRIDYDDEDALIHQYISAARQRLEQKCARVFVEQTWELRTAAFDTLIEIPKPPTQEILQVSYLDTSHVEQTVDDALYAFIDGGDHESSSLIWLDADEIPDQLAERPDAARVRFTAGWAVVDVPFAIKQATLFLAGHLYENREAVLLAPVRQELQILPESVDAFIAPYIVPRL